MTKNETRIVYVNGAYVPESEANISIFDASFFLGDAVFDVSRTFNGVPFKLKAHINRLFRSMRAARMTIDISADEVEEISLKVLDANLPLLRANDEYWICQVVSAGIHPRFRQEGISYRDTSLVVYCWPIPFRALAKDYKIGTSVVTPSTRRMPSQCLDPKIKTISREDLNIVGREVKIIDPDSYALLLDMEGNVVEGRGQNFFIIENGTLVTPGTRSILEGITRQTVIEIAEELGILVKERDIQMYNIYNADEVFLTATSFCILPVTLVNKLKIGEGRPGPITNRLLKAFSEKVGVNIVEQALRHLDEKEQRELDEIR